MTDSARLFIGTVPELYDRFMGPAIFEPVTAQVADHIATHHPRRLLEVAAGTGLLTEALHLRLPDTVILATDLNEPMIDYAARHRDTEGVVWEVADVAALPYPDASFDLVACQFGAMFFPDRPAAYREMGRTLVPDGTMVLAVWDSIQTNDFARTLVETIRELIPDNPPVFTEKIPHGYFDTDLIRTDVRAAGFTDISIDTVSATSLANAEDLAVGFVQGTPLWAEVEERVSGGFDQAVDAVRDALIAAHGTGLNDEISGELTAFVVTARR